MLRCEGFVSAFLRHERHAATGKSAAHVQIKPFDWRNKGSSQFLWGDWSQTRMPTVLLAKKKPKPPPGSLTARPWKSDQNPTGKESSFLSQGRAVKLRGSMLQSRAKASPPTRILYIYIYIWKYIRKYIRKTSMGNPQLPPKHLAVRHHLHQWEEH